VPKFAENVLMNVVSMKWIIASIVLNAANAVQ
jgi:hypothetical protein